MATIDNLDIQISASADKASKSLEKLASQMESFATSLGMINSSGISTMTSSMEQLGRAMQSLAGVKKSDYNRIAKGLNSIASVDSAKLGSVSSVLTPLATSLSELSNVNFNGSNINNVINALTRLANANTASLATLNLSNLGTQISNLSTVLNGAERVNTNSIQIINAIARLANAGERASVVTAILPNMSVALRNFFSVMSGAPIVASETIQFTNAIGALAGTGPSIATVSANLGTLATALRQFFTTMSTAPAINNNIIQMTQALANLASQGRNISSASRLVSNGFNTMSFGTDRASKSFKGLAYTFGKFYANFWFLVRAMKGIKESIDISSDLTEVQNVVVNTFGQYTDKVEKLADSAIENFGMSELLTKQISSRFQAMGTAMGLSLSGMGDKFDFINTKIQSMSDEVKKLYGNTDGITDMSLNLTKLAADMASFYNVAQSDVAEDLESIFTGQTRPLRTYGLDLTQATLKEWALKNGLDADIKSMSQAEKTMLRYQYVMANADVAMGDFARTSNTWANQVRMLQENLKQLGTTLGKAFINLLKPLVRTLNSALLAVNKFVENVVNALGKIFGWEMEITNGTIAEDLDGAAGGAYDTADGLGNAAKNAKELNKQLQGFDELNVITTNDGSSGKRGSGSGSGDGAGSGSTDNSISLKSTKGLFESSIKDMEGLGEYIGDAIASQLESINWDSVYQSAKDFGTGLASFLNGLISPRLFYAVGNTIARSLNTSIYSALSFAETFDWSNFGTSLASGVNGFFENFDFKSLAKTLNKWVDGLETTVVSFVKNVKWSEVISGALDFANGIEIDTLAFMIGAFAWFHGGKKLVASALANMFKVSYTSAGTLSVGIGVKIAILAITFKCGFDIGKKIAEFIGEMTGDIDLKDAAINFTWSDFFSSFTDGSWKGALVLQFKDAMEGLKVLAKVGFIPFETAWKSVCAWFASTGLPDFFDKKIAPKFTKEYWSKKVNGMYTGMKGKFSEFSTWLSGTGLPNFFNNVVAPKFTKEYWQTKSHGMYSGLKSKFNEFSAWFSGTGLPDFFENKVKPKFTKEYWENKVNGMYSGLKSKFNEFVTWFSGTGLPDFFTYKVAPKFTTEYWSNKVKGMYSGLKSKWDEFTDWWNNTGFKDWWDKHVTNAFSKDNWNFSGIKDGLKTAWDNAVAEIKRIWNGFAEWFNKNMTFQIPEAEVFGKKFGGQTITLGKVPKFSTGGFPEDGLFMANHGELLGRFSNGRTAVANNAQITAGIREAAYLGMKQALAESGNNGNNVNIRVEGDSNKIFKVVREEAKIYSNSTGRNAFQF